MSKSQKRKRLAAMSKAELAAEQVVYLRKLVTAYRSGEHRFGDVSCPLCKRFRFPNCDYCPWVAATEHRCVEATGLNRILCRLTRRGIVWPRVMQLERWIRRLSVPGSSF